MNRLTTGFAIAVLLAAAGCKKQEESAPPPAPAKVADPAPAAVDPAAAAEAEKKQKEQAAIDEALTELEAKTAAEKARWTDDLKKQTVALTEKSFKDAKAALAAIVASGHRKPGHADRDQHRHPVETLTFFGIKPNMTVVEMGAGEGYYTELLAPLLARSGKLIVLSPDPAGPSDKMTTVYGKRVAAMTATAPEVFGKTTVTVVAPPDNIQIAPDGSVDLVLAAREMHGWQRRGNLDAFLAAIHRALKDGGVFAVEQHRAKPDGKAEETAAKGYLPEAFVIEKVEAAGFKLAGKSEINANPKDTKDYEGGVWTLPPNLNDVAEADKAKYQAIGESDRMTLRFTKVAKAGDKVAPVEPPSTK